jgi:aminomethyltransferase
VTALLKTALHTLHQQLGAKLVPFAGYDMPVQYPLGVLKEHLHTRRAAGLFDVSHMGQIKLTGDNIAQALEALVPVDVIGLPVGMQRYALFTNEQGGIRDDLMITNCGDHFILVVNAACKQADAEYLRANLPDSIQLEELTDKALLALQGPKAREVLARFAPAAADLIFMHTAVLTVAGAECFVSCSGYSGEDGYEISVDNDHAVQVAKALLAEEEVEAIGLGARDSLRLEAGLCLYGHDLDEVITPIEASLLWAISKPRRPDGERAGGYPGADKIAEQLAGGVSKKRVMLKPLGRAPVREGAEIVNAAEDLIGKVSSGGFGPTVGGPVVMAYVDQAALDKGEALFAKVRGKLLSLERVSGGLLTSRYYRG